MAQRVNVTNGTWQNIGTGPAIVQLISPSGNGVEVMVECEATAPTGSDGMVLNGQNPIIKFSLAQNIWAQAIQNGTAIVNVQPDVAG
jgi:hypothetical protein